MHASSAPDEPGRGTRLGATWEPFGIPDSEYGQATARGGTRVLNLTLPRPGAGKDRDRAAAWLRNAMIGLGALAVSAAVVSFAAQFHMVYEAKHLTAIAALEAGIPDAAALVFASLGIALALHGKRAVRARALNVGAVATSIAMNLLAAAPGWRNLAIWIMPPIAYALASDTAIGVIRAYAIARQRELSEALAEDETTPLAILAGVALWMLRLILAPPSTLSGFRRWVVESCPVAPGRRAIPATDVTALPAAPAPGSAVIPSPEPQEPRRPDPYGPRWPDRQRRQRGESKTRRFLQLVEDRHGPFVAIDPAKVSRICSDLAPEVGLNAGSARSALRPLVLAAQNGHSS
jgi:Protein of unknown function (DUF2637)